ncbi:hypothetical protein, partial [Klebsiella michiganensis]
AGRHRGDLIELIAQSVDHKTLCLSFFTRPLLGIPQRAGGLFFAKRDRRWLIIAQPRAAIGIWQEKIMQRVVMRTERVYGSRDK